MNIWQILMSALPPEVGEHHFLGLTNPDINLKGMHQLYNWAASWQNQQNNCAHSEDSDQPGQPPSLIIEATVSVGPSLCSVDTTSYQTKLDIFNLEFIEN